MASSEAVEGPKQHRYAEWSREQLIERLNQIDSKARKTWTAPPPPKADDKVFVFSKYPRRKIALKFCYSGWEYSGLAFQAAPTPLPTVENVLFDVLAQTRLVDPDAGFEGCGWEKCGRTDRGVSAAGQVVSLWIRSALPLSEPPSLTEPSEPSSQKSELEDDLISPALPENTSIPKKNARPKNEHDYLAIINRLLPETIRVLAWSPIPESFSARFSCKYRHYKYFFPSAHLDIPRMQAAAERLLGDHDFQNLCKVDAQKQITSFRRKILRATVTPLDESPGDIHVLDLVGTAFLYHQVRHIMAILLLVGSGLEPPSIVSQLMNTAEDLETPHGDERYILLNRKPEYQMADALPLMLWECGYDESLLDWRTSNQPPETMVTPVSWLKLHQQLMGICQRSQVYTALNAHFLKAAARYHPEPVSLLPIEKGQTYAEVAKGKSGRDSFITVPLGGGMFKRTQKYVPMMERTRLDPVDVINERWRAGRQLKLAKDAASSSSGSP